MKKNKISEQYSDSVGRGLNIYNVMPDFSLMHFKSKLKIILTTKNNNEFFLLFLNGCLLTCPVLISKTEHWQVTGLF